MTVEPKSSGKKRIIVKRNVKSKTNESKMRSIAQSVIKSVAEVKRHVSRNDFSLAHTVLAGYTWNYFNLLDVITIGTGQSLRIGQKIKLDHINMSVLVQAETGLPVEFEVAILQLPYQATSYTYQQIWAAPTTGSVFNVNGPFTHMYNKDFVTRAIGYTKIHIDPGNDEDASKWVTKKVSLKQNFIYQDGSNYSQSGKDWYVVFKAVSPGTGATVTTIGEASISTHVCYTDL